ncbi:addiction module antidote protein [Bartonella sp. DGB1]|uniref:addiction module antidote protein n=1 Tax=Bartonella sp. DGB1 TaxID=3239807 RepID=UPI00352657CC
MELNDFKAENYLTTAEAQRTFLNEAFKTQDAKHIANALGIVARAQGMSSVAKDAALNRSGLYRSLNENGDPKLSTLISVLNALNLQLASYPCDITK